MHNIYYYYTVYYYIMYYFRELQACCTEENYNIVIDYEIEVNCGTFLDASRKFDCNNHYSYKSI